MIDQTILGELQAMLLEPVDNGQSWPSGLWTRDEVINYLTQRQTRLQKEAQLHVALADPNLDVIVGQHRVDLPADCVRVVSAVWIGDDDVVRELVRSESFSADHQIPTWEATNAAYPLTYMEVDGLQNQIQIAPGPLVTGEIEVLYIPKGAPLTGNGVALLVPDDLGPVLKYGVLHDQLAKDGRGQDLSRAAYCQMRYQLGVQVIRQMLKGWS